MSDLIRKGSEIQGPKAERCKRCFKPIKEDGHAGMCSSDCAQATSEDVSQSKLRELILERDKGVCASCGAKCLELAAMLEQLRSASVSKGASRETVVLYQSRVHQLVRLGFPRGPVERGESLWACDHKLERAAGGESRPDQCQTLCLACHAKKTSAFASKRTGARKPKRGFGR